MRFRFRFALALAFSLASIVCAAVLANGRLDTVTGEWVVRNAWSPNDYLTRRNVRPGTEIDVNENGYIRVGRLGIDGIVGRADCGHSCFLMTVNLTGQTFEVLPSGKGESTLLLVNQDGAQVIVAERKTRK